MNYEEFEKIVTEKAMNYAKEVVDDCENHMDAVEAIASDFSEGALYAFNLLNQ